MRIYLLTLLIFAVSGLSSAQTSGISVELEFSGGSVSKSAKSIPANVIITNTSAESTQTTGLGTIEFQFSICPDKRPDLLRCNMPGSRFFSVFEMPLKDIPGESSTVFAVDLGNLKWQYLVGPLGSEVTEAGIADLSDKLIYLTVRSKKFDGFSSVQEDDFDENGISIGSRNKRRPKYIETISNVVTVVIKP